MNAFATAGDYRAIHDTDVSDARLDALLGRASRDIASELRAAGIAYAASDEDFADDLSDVAIAMVHRAVGEDAGDADGPQIPFGASQFSQTGGPYSAQATLSNPYGDLFMTNAERLKLGIGLPRACVLSPYQ